MKLIISPAKKMNVDTDSLPWQALPAFLPQTETLREALQAMTAGELKALWKCNDKILEQNLERLAGMDLKKNLTPALLAYEGIQYQYMAPGVFTQQQLDWVADHLRILSGFYGLLRPFDGVVPYRLEMQAKLKTPAAKDLYAFWGGSLAAALFAETDCVINLASKEYSQCIQKYLPPAARFITCVFGEEKEGKIIEKGTLCKMARGEMVRFLAEQGAQSPEVLKSFDRLGYRFDESRSTPDTFVFLLQPERS